MLVRQVGLVGYAEDYSDVNGMGNESLNNIIKDTFEKCICMKCGATIAAFKDEKEPTCPVCDSDAKERKL
jgi:rubrerythrin